MNQYKMSIIIPVYNAEKFLETAIKSVMMQTIGFENLEMLLINDGSVDNSDSICREYTSKYPDNIKYYFQENSGVSVARNKGLKEAKGKYIIFLDSDDYLEKNVCKNVYAFFEKEYENTDIVVFPFKYLMPNNEYKDNFRYKKLYTKGTAVYDIIDNPELIQATINFCIKNNFENNLLFDKNIKFSEDEKYATEIIMKKKKIGYCSNCLYIYRRHEESANGKYVMTQEVFDKFIKYYKSLFENHENIVYIQNLFLNTLRWRLLDEKLWPSNVNKEQKEKNINKITKLLDNVLVSSIKNLDSINIFHKIYICKLKLSKFKVITDNEKCQLVVDSTVMLENKNFKCYIDDIDFKDGKVNITGILLTPLFEFKKPQLEFNYKNTKKIIKLHKSEFSNYKCSTETNYIYKFSYSFDYKLNSEFDFKIIVDSFKFDVNVTFNEKNKNYIIKHGNIYMTDKNSVKVKKYNFISSIKLYSMIYPKKIIKKVLSFIK